MNPHTKKPEYYSGAAEKINFLGFYSVGVKTNVLGVQINCDTKNSVIFLIKKLLAENQKIFIATPYSEMLVRAQKDRRFRDILNSATLALPDGIGVLWAAHFLTPSLKQREGRGELWFWKLISSLLAVIFYPKNIRDPIPEKISGSDFVWDLAGLAADRGYSVFLLGGYGDTPSLAADKLKSKFPGLRISTLAPRGRGEGEGVIEKINLARPDFLFVALGPVRQEKWIAENLPKLNVKLAIGLGGTFDYLASRFMLAPQIWRNLGLEWLWRLLTQPWRLRRISRGVLGLIYYAVKYKLK